jgi:anti-sigma regulatory factor (Ser/Thr protein kinase)
VELLLALPADDLAPQMTRGALGFLASLFPPAFVDDVRLLTNELVTNVIKHGGLEPSDQLEVHAEGSPKGVLVEVVGGRQPFSRRATTPNGLATSGWGLLLVGSLSNRWGYRQDEETAVWFELDRARRLTAEQLPPEVGQSPIPWRRLLRRRRQQAS